ncbi:type II toxin-antitoxin system RelE/ParE family toxin [Levilactobacillus yonginensis]|uniref:type II toxin-antitoxin system RelE/ParE family toxin n=1 Tax=Levilactobacillus yonginensis TaxID=1054041 RepID=UPI000F791429|nr:type II toxin-antitoxin system RelE/ParE family toxin [Levilactobacillus yonginensis]
MKYQLALYAEARNDLLRLKEYLITAFDKTVQEKTLTSIAGTLDQLAHFPNLGLPVSSLVDEDIYLVGFFVFQTARNTILYEIDELANQVIILRIFGNRQDVAHKVQYYLMNQKRA